jgi:signal transduction histidine kinase
VRGADARGGASGDGGAGLGLPIARWVAEVHGGHLELTRSDEHGSEFVVELPGFGTRDSGLGIRD